jgi:predicted RNA-binding protein YlxR (DUF448 family)
MLKAKKKTRYIYIKKDTNFNEKAEKKVVISHLPLV